MAENGGSDESEFNSVTSSQKYFLRNCPFADPVSCPTESYEEEVVETASDNTEILGNQISPPVVRTPILSFSSPTSLDSTNDDDVFGTPPENASLSSAADSEPKVRFSKLKSPSSKTEMAPISPSLPLGNVSVLQRKPLSGSVTGVLIPVREVVVPLSSQPSVPANDVTGPDSPSPTAIGRSRVLENERKSDSVGGDTGVTKSSSPVRVPGKPLNLAGSSFEKQVAETENCGGDLPLKEIIETLLRNSGKDPNERDGKVSILDILTQCGLRFPK